MATPQNSHRNSWPLGKVVEVFPVRLDVFGNPGHVGVVVSYKGTALKH